MADETNFEEEVERIRQKLAENPKSRIFLQLAEIYRKNGKYDEAEEVLKNGLQVHPDYWTAKVALAKLYIEQNYQDKATQLLEEVTEKIPDNLLANQLLGDLYYERQEFTNALKYYNNVLSLNPQDESRAARVKELSNITAGTPVPESKEEKDTTGDEEPEPELYREIPEQKVDDIIEVQEVATGEEKDDEGEIPKGIEIPEIDFTEPVDSISEGELEIEEEPVEEALIGDEAREEIEISKDSAPEDAIPKAEGEEAGESLDDADEIPTVTLATLYFDQGHKDKALDILDKVLDQNPDDEKALELYEELTRKTGGLDADIKTDEEPTKSEERSPDSEGELQVEEEIADIMKTEGEVAEKIEAKIEEETKEEIKPEDEEDKGPEEEIQSESLAETRIDEDEEEGEEIKTRADEVPEKETASDTTPEETKKEEEDSVTVKEIEEKAGEPEEDRKLKLLLKWLDNIT